MAVRRVYRFSSTFLTIVLVFVLYLIAKQNDWKILSLLTGVYLFIVLGFFVLIILALILIFSMFSRKTKRKKPIDAIDVDYRIKE